MEGLLELILELGGRILGRTFDYVAYYLIIYLFSNSYYLYKLLIMGLHWLLLEKSGESIPLGSGSD